jgi:membrane protease YdiL (CAAX protease family)
MEEIRPNNLVRTPLVSILLTLLIFAVGFQFLGPALGAVIGLLLYAGSESELWKALQDPFQNPDTKIIILIMQGCGALVGLILLPYYLLRRQQRKLSDFFQTPHLRPAIIVPVLVIVFMGVNAIFIHWNKGIELPFGVDDWARSMEEKLGEMTVFITQYDSQLQMFLAFIVVVVLPAIGEEIVFRGMIQNDFYRATRNAHVAIWVSAFLFSAIHLQFYGFFPRMFLGALFGYLYFWSGNLWMPVLAHFVNNGFTLVSLYLYDKGTINIDMENAQPTVWQVLFSVVFSAFLLYAFKNFYNNQPKADIPD